MIKVIAYTVDTIGNEVLIRDSEGEEIRSADVNELIQFLNEPFPEYLAIRVFWDLDTDIAPILRKLGIPACKELASPEHSYRNLFYIPSKLFVIRDDKHPSFFYHLSQYYPDEPSPNDAETIAGMAQEVIDAFKAMGLNPKKLTSPVAIYETEVMSTMSIPTIMNISSENEQIIEYAENCLGVPDNLHFWIQAYQVGHWLAGDIFEYDIRAAYPAIACKLRSLQYARYAKSPYLQPEADWGFMRGMVTIEDGVKVSPIFDEEGKQRTGTFPAYITLQDYQWIRKWEVGDFKHDMGYYLKFRAPVYPMEVPMRRLFNQRGFGSMTDRLSKRISTAFGFGKWLEKHEDGTVGQFYNPVYACMVVAMNNLKVADFIYKNGLQDDLVHVGVDGILTTKEAKVGDQNKIGMGDWRFAGIGPALVLSSGRIYHADKKPQGLNYQEILDLISEHPRETFYQSKLYRRQTLDESIQLNDLAGLGKVKLTNSSFDLGLLRTTTDRHFPDFPRNGHELLNGQYPSIPLKHTILSPVA